MLTMDPYYMTHKLLNGNWTTADGSLAAEIRDFGILVSHDGSKASGRFSFAPVMMGMMTDVSYDAPIIAVGPDILLKDSETEYTVTGMSLSGECLEIILTDRNRSETVFLLFKENNRDD